MSESLKEMMSAMIDGEASEFEFRRVLDSLGDVEARDRLSRHYALRTLMRKDAGRLCPPRTSAAILDALREQEDVAVRVAAWRVPLRNIAVAASVCMAVVIGSETLLRDDDPSGDLAQFAGAASGAASLGALGPSARTARTVSNPAQVIGFASAVPVAAGATEAFDAEANRAAHERLRQYLLEHAHDASLNANQGMLPYARVVSFEEP